MNKAQIWSRAAAGVGIVALVLVTNECYRQVRAFVDEIKQSRQDIAVLKRELYVLQVQLDNRPMAQLLAPAAEPAAHAVAEIPPPPSPMAATLPLPSRDFPGLSEQVSKPRQKPGAGEGEAKSLVSVVLMSDAKPTAAPASDAIAKPAEGPKMDVQLIGASK